MPKKKAAPKKKVVKRAKATPKKKLAPKKKASAKKKPAPKKKSVRRKPAGLRGLQETSRPVAIRSRRGLGSAAGGQSGDIQGLSRGEEAESESVEELAEEGQSFEAELVDGVENALDPDQGEVTTTEVPEDDVPGEYDERNKI